MALGDVFKPKRYMTAQERIDSGENPVTAIPGGFAGSLGNLVQRFQPAPGLTDNPMSLKGPSLAEAWQGVPTPTAGQFAQAEQDRYAKRTPAWRATPQQSAGSIVRTATASGLPVTTTPVATPGPQTLSGLPMLASHVPGKPVMPVQGSATGVPEPVSLGQTPAAAPTGTRQTVSGLPVQPGGGYITMGNRTVALNPDGSMGGLGGFTGTGQVPGQRGNSRDIAMNLAENGTWRSGLPTEPGAGPQAAQPGLPVPRSASQIYKDLTYGNTTWDIPDFMKYRLAGQQAEQESDRYKQATFNQAHLGGIDLQGRYGLAQEQAKVQAGLPLLESQIAENKAKSGLYGSQQKLVEAQSSPEYLDRQVRAAEAKAKADSAGKADAARQKQIDSLIRQSGGNSGLPENQALAGQYLQQFDAHNEALAGLFNRVDPTSRMQYATLYKQYMSARPEERQAMLKDNAQVQTMFQLVDNLGRRYGVDPWTRPVVPMFIQATKPDALGLGGAEG